MALQTSTEVFISGIPIQSYVSLKLSQEIGAHQLLKDKSILTNSQINHADAYIKSVENGY